MGLKSRLGRYGKALGLPESPTSTESPNSTEAPAPMFTPVDTGLRRIVTRHGVETESGRWLARLQVRFPTGRIPLDRLDPRLEPASLSNLVVIDTETTGLSGGAGVLAFLIGIARVRSDGIEVRQWLIEDPSRESLALEELLDAIGPDGLLVSYNGKSFDQPLLASRLISNRIRKPLAPPHLDLLHLVRRLFRRRLGDCSLGAIERKLLGHERVEDIPSHLIPEAYFRFLRGEDREWIENVITHNRQDLLSLLGVLDLLLHRIEAPEPSRDPSSDPESGEDALSLGYHYEAIDDGEAAIRSYRKSLQLARGATRYRTYTRLGDLLRRRGRPDEAALVWRAMIADFPDHGPEGYVALAKDLEHRVKDLAAALEITRQAQENLASGGLYRRHREYARTQRELAHRRDRLEGRIRRRAVTASGPRRRRPGS